MIDERGAIVIVDTNNFDAFTTDRARIPGTTEGNERLEDRMRSVLDIRAQ